MTGSGPGPAVDHWNDVWSRRDPEDVSWFQDSPEPSLSLIEAHASMRGAAIDVGGGVSGLAPALVAAGFDPVIVLDIAQQALDRGVERWNDPRVHAVCADVRSWRTEQPVALWHDRALLHFMVDDADVAAYMAAMTSAVAPGGLVVLATFAADGPTSCSGLPVRRFDAADLEAATGPEFDTVTSTSVAHRTPSGAPQSFTYLAARRTTPAAGSPTHNTAGETAR